MATCEGTGPSTKPGNQTSVSSSNVGGGPSMIVIFSGSLTSSSMIPGQGRAESYHSVPNRGRPLEGESHFDRSTALVAGRGDCLAILLEWKPVGDQPAGGQRAFHEHLDHQVKSMQRSAVEALHPKRLGSDQVGLLKPDRAGI